MKKLLKVLLGIVIAIAVIIGVVFFVVNSQTTNEEVTLGDDVIPTIYAVLGERKVIAVSSGVAEGYSYKTMTYDAGVVSIDDINEYGLYLDEKDFVVTENNSELLQLAKESVDDGKVIIVNITFEGNNVIVEYKKGEGTLTIY